VEFAVERLVEIWQRVARAVPEAQLIVVGRGLRGEERMLLQLVAECGLREHVRYLGWPGWVAMPGILAAADVALMPFDDTLINRTKCPARLVELMAAGLPVVADGVGQNREYIEDRVSGRLVPPGDVGAFANAMVELLLDRERRHAMGSAAAERVAGHFTWQRLALTVEQAYQGV
jgi:glycosyltransferase involved in cell wall biosynthesis